jgi:hypothetical protein
MMPHARALPPPAGPWAWKAGGVRAEPGRNGKGFTTSFLMQEIP